MDTVTRYFTFGYDHTDPVTNVSLANRYVTITARSHDECRTLMMALYGREWAFDYAKAPGEPNFTVSMREHARHDFGDIHVRGMGLSALAETRSERVA